MHLILAGLIAAAALSQVGTSRLEGIIEDPSGAVMPEAAITAENEKNGLRTTVFSDSLGYYVFLSLAPGQYTLTVQADGFRPGVLRGVALNVATTVAAPVRLEISAAAQTVSVEAKQTTIQGSDAQVGREVVLRDIEVLPQLERNPIALAIFQPGVQIVGGNIGFSRVNGTRLGSNVVKVDGIDATDLTNGTLAFSGFAATTDSTAQFRVITHGGKAEYGRAAGAQVEMISRSGTNRWSGNVFDYHRNTVLNANDFFNNAAGVPRPAIIQNVFGGSVGGPLRRDRTFVFATYEGRRTHEQEVRNRTVLTPAARGGVFRWIPPGSTDIRTFNIVSADPRGKGIDTEVAESLRLLPDPNNSDIGDGLNVAGFRFNSPSDGSDNKFTVRVDHNLRSATRLFFRLTRFGFDGIDAINNADAPFPGQPHGTLRLRGLHYSLGADWALSPRMVNELRFGSQILDGPTFARPARLPEPMINSVMWTNPLNPQFGADVGAPIHEVTDNLSFQRGFHLFKLGGSWHSATLSRSSDEGIYPNILMGRGNGNAPPSAIGPSGSLISTSDRITFENLYNHLLGRMAVVSQTFYSDLERFQPPGTARVRNYRLREYGYFLQDDWKVRRNLTLNVGLRYEFNGVPSERDRLQGVADKAGEISMTSQIADLTVARDTRWYRNDFNNVAPRVGLAWDPWGNGRSAVRANYGIYYERLVGAVTNYLDSVTPGFSQNLAVFPNAQGVDRRISDGVPLPAQPLAPVVRPDLTRQTFLNVIHPGLRTGYVQQYSLTLQRELFRNTVIEAGLVGNRGVKLFMYVNPNQVRIDGDFLRSFREIQAFLANGIPVASGNTLARLFGSVGSAIQTIGETTLRAGEAAFAADIIDRTYYTRYAATGLSDFYLRNFPQYNQLLLGTNDGRTYYDSLQFSLRRQSGALKFVANYTWSKTIDIISGQGESGLSRPVDSFNLRLNRARSDQDRPHVFNGSFVYTLPIGRDRGIGGTWPPWLDSMIGGWDLGVLGLWESGAVFSVVSGRRTAGDPLLQSYANYDGDRNIGRVERRADGVFWLSPEEIQRFSFPAAGEIGSSGRNAFRGPRHFNVDLSLVKRFRFKERDSLSFRAEFYNLFNNPNFRNPSVNLSIPAAFGRISATASGGPGIPVGGTSGGPRIVQLMLRYEF
jgi:hypothetical protein